MHKNSISAHGTGLGFLSLNFTTLYSRKIALNCSQPPKKLSITTYIAQWRDVLTPTYANTDLKSSLCRLLTAWDIPHAGFLLPRDGKSPAQTVTPLQCAYSSSRKGTGTVWLAAYGRRALLAGCEVSWPKCEQENKTSPKAESPRRKLALSFW